MRTHHEFERSTWCKEPVATPDNEIEPIVILQFIHVNISHNKSGALHQTRLQVTTELLLKHKFEKLVTINVYSFLETNEVGSSVGICECNPGVWLFKNSKK